MFHGPSRWSQDDDPLQWPSSFSMWNCYSFIPKLLLLPIILPTLHVNRNNNSCGFTLKATAKVLNGTTLATTDQNL